MPLTPKLIAVATSAAVLIAGGATAAAVNARPAPEVTAVPAALIETPQTVEVLVWADGAARRVARLRSPERRRSAACPGR